MAPDRLHLISVDYTKDQDLADAVAHMVSDVGPIELLLTWIHSTAPQALGVIEKTLKHTQAEPWKHFQVNGSRTYLELPPNASTEETATRHIILGFVLEGDSSRWHTHQEIAQRVIHAIESDAFYTIVGTCEPWEKRP